MLKLLSVRKARGCSVTGTGNVQRSKTKAMISVLVIPVKWQRLIDAQRSSSHRTEYADQFVFGAHLDLAKIAGWQDTEAQIPVTQRNGQSLSQSAAALNGHLSSVQEVWGRGQTWRSD